MSDEKTTDELAKFARQQLPDFFDQTEEDVWYSCGEKWDVNLLHEDNVIHATAYPVEDGHTIGGEWITLWTTIHDTIKPTYGDKNNPLI